MSIDQKGGVVIAPIAGRVRIFFDDAEIASTLEARRLEEAGQAPRIFVPMAAVLPGILEASETIRHDPGRGEAHFYNLKTLTADGPDAAWYYPYADGTYAAIRDLLTFGGTHIDVRHSQV